MLRGDNVICGTTTTGTGTLTLAACPVPPGGVDFDVYFRAKGFANSAVLLVTYRIVEYTDSTFATPKQSEKGIGTLTLGSSSGIANCTLARTTVQETSTSMNSQPASGTILGSAITIGTAANVLVFIGTSSSDVFAIDGYLQTTIGDSNWGSSGLSVVFLSSSLTGTTISTGTEAFLPFVWLTPMLVKRGTIRVVTAYTGGTPVSNACMRLYAVGTDGRPGKLLLDLGLLGSANASFNSTGNVSTALHSTGYFLEPGEYFLSIPWIFSGGSSGPALLATNTVVGPRITSGRFGVSSGALYNQFYNLSPTTGAAPDPATLTGWGGDTGAGAGRGPVFGLSPT